VRSPKVRACVCLMLLVAWIGISASLARADESESFLLKKVEKPKPKEDNRSHKLDLLFQASQIYLSSGTSVDGVTTGLALNHRPIARQADGVFLMSYPSRETGWVSRFGLQNPSGVIAANVGLNLGIGLLSRRMYRRGGRWRLVQSLSSRAARCGSGGRIHQFLWRCSRIVSKREKGTER